MWEFQEKRAATRYKTRLLCRLSLLGTVTAAVSPARAPKVVGYTHDISATGLAVIVASINAHAYLTDLTATLLTVLELPTGQIEIETSPVRVERLKKTDPDDGYLVGLHIRQISEGVRSRFEKYLYTLG